MMQPLFYDIFFYLLAVTTLLENHVPKTINFRMPRHQKKLIIIIKNRCMPSIHPCTKNSNIIVSRVPPIEVMLIRVRPIGVGRYTKKINSNYIMYLYFRILIFGYQLPQVPPPQLQLFLYCSTWHLHEKKLR